MITNEIERKVKIYLDLKKYDSAIGVLSKGDKNNWYQALHLIEKYSLFNYGLKIFSENDEISMKIKELLGDYMLSKKDFTQAATLFLSAKNYIKALDAYKSNGDWKEALNLANYLKYTEIQKNSLINEMADYLNTIGKYTVKFLKLTIFY